MSYQASSQTSRRLRWHAGLEQAANGARVSIAERTGVTTIGERLDEALNDLLSPP